MVFRDLPPNIQNVLIGPCGIEIRLGTVSSVRSEEY